MNEPRTSRWLLRSAWAGTAAALFGVGIGTLGYRALPGTERMDWSMMAIALFGYALFTGVSSGLGIGAGTALAVRSGGGARKVGALRLTSLGALGGIAGCTVPALVGIAGFGSLHAPYAGTANLVFCTLVVCTTFVTLWAPTLWGRDRDALGRGAHIGVAAMASSLAVASLGILAVSLVSTLGLVPTLGDFVALSRGFGLFEMSLAIGLVAGALVGATAGFATWLYLSTVIALERRLATGR
jgi:hypothetical protein